METDTKLQTAAALMTPWAKASKTPEPNRLDVILDAGDALPAIEALNAAHWGFLSAITGLDPGAAASELEILYHFCSGAAVLTLRAHTPRDKPSVSTICGAIPSAVLFERELKEMFGVDVVGLADREHLFLPEDWQEGVYPLRKDSKI
jgi:Ni,Fe-hydrogenase III component G